MKISWIKQKGDEKNFKVVQNLGMNVVELENPENIDKELNRLINNNYNTIFLSSDIAGFSGDIVKKYKKDNNINIIIVQRK